MISKDSSEIAHKILDMIGEYEEFDIFCATFTALIAMAKTVKLSKEKVLNALDSAWEE